MSLKFAESFMPFAALYLSAIMSLVWRERQILVSYLSSFLPVVGALVILNTGRHMAEKGEILGYLFSWGAPLSLIIIAAFYSRRLYKAG